MQNIKNQLSLVLLLGLLFRKVPVIFWQPFLDKAIKVMQDKHHRVFDRLSEHDFDFIIDAIDVPFQFYLKPSQVSPVLRAIKREDKSEASAVIRGSLVNLLRLFEGRVDGDAMFFSKELIIEGSTAASVALRNAIDGENMDIIEDLSYMFSPFEKIFKKLGILGVNKYSEFQSNLDSIVGAILGYVNKDIDELKNRLVDMENALDNIEEVLKKLNREQIRKKSDYTNLSE